MKMTGRKIYFFAEKEIYLRAHSDLHVILLNLQIVPVMQNLNGHKSLHGIIGLSINTKTTKCTFYIFGYYCTRLKARQI